MPEIRALYRLSSGEVLKISTESITKPAQEFPDRDPTIFGVAINPSVPDGTQVREETSSSLGPLRVLGLAKHYDLAAHTVRNATTSDLNAYAVSENNDNNELDRRRAVHLFESDPAFRKIFIAFADMLMQEINTLRAQHGLPKRTLAQIRAAIGQRVSKDE
ncbi:hypothetical protein COW64_25820 [bacterium (Candidatus Blackallbacteria) CG18_big_fil_WC_8_21_14_2_50_49_26]|nr:MAG: hypothetical protein COW64_25820 [bacterium (Candidatus Blackallbacteria) CG18_big_fil_WC_8_21_14_2_50_49_26]